MALVTLRAKIRRRIDKSIGMQLVLARILNAITTWMVASSSECART